MGNWAHRRLFCQPPARPPARARAPSWELTDVGAFSRTRPWKQYMPIADDRRNFVGRWANVPGFGGGGGIMGGGGPKPSGWLLNLPSYYVCTIRWAPLKEEEEGKEEEEASGRVGEKKEKIQTKKILARFAVGIDSIICEICPHNTRQQDPW